MEMSPGTSSRIAAVSNNIVAFDLVAFFDKETGIMPVEGGYPLTVIDVNSEAEDGFQPEKVTVPLAVARTGVP